MLTENQQKSKFAKCIHSQLDDSMHQNKVGPSRSI